MISLVISLVVVALVIGGAIWAVRSLTAHSAKWTRLTEARGFDLELQTTEVLDFPFDIFQRVSDRRAWTLISRSGSGDCTFLYKFKVGEEERRERRTCSLIELDVAAPHTVIRPRALQTAPPGPADGPDVRISSPAFTDVFRVQSADPAFAERLLAGGPAEWLSSSEGKVGTVELELRGTWLLAIAPTVATPEALMDFHDWGQQLRRRIAPAVG